MRARHVIGILGAVVLLVVGISGALRLREAARPATAPPTAPAAPDDSQIQSLRALAVAQPEDPNGWIDLGQALAQRNEPAAALQAFEQAIGVAPSLPRALIGAGQMWSRLGRHGRAVALYQRALRGATQSDGTLQPGVGLEDVAHLNVEIALNAMEVRDFATAFQHGHRARELAPADPEPLRALSLIAARSGAAEGAVNFAQQATDLAPADALSWMQLGAAQLAGAQFAAALPPLTRAHEIEPDLERAYVLAAEAIIEGGPAVGEPDEAQRLLRRALELQPDDAGALFLLGRAHLARDDSAAAAKALRRARELDPSSREAALSLGEALRRQGDADGARAVLIEAETLEDRTVRFRALEVQAERSNDPALHLRLAELYQRAGRLESAAWAARRGLERAPDDAALHARAAELAAADEAQTAALLAR